jgi:hypothetical protein
MLFWICPQLLEKQKMLLITVEWGFIILGYILLVMGFLHDNKAKYHIAGLVCFIIYFILDYLQGK